MKYPIKGTVDVLVHKEDAVEFDLLMTNAGFQLLSTRPVGDTSPQGMSNKFQEQFEAQSPKERGRL